MLYIKKGTIRLTRGDTARFEVEITNDLTGQPYEMQEGDVLCFTVKRTVYETEFLIRKEVQHSTSFSLAPADTASLAFGRYVYDVQLTTAAGDVFTVIEPNTFEILTEVTT